LEGKELKHSEITNMLTMSRSNCFHHLSILLQFGFINRIERKIPSISGKKSYYDVKTKTMKTEKTAYFYELTNKGSYAISYFKGED
jgi:predicted transcriptional regulator